MIWFYVPDKRFSFFLKDGGWVKLKVEQSDAKCWKELSKGV